MPALTKLLAATSILALTASAAAAGEGYGFGGCSFGHTAQLVEVTKEETTMSTFDGDHLNLMEIDEAAAVEAECAEGDVDCQPEADE